MTDLYKITNVKCKVQNWLRKVLVHVSRGSWPHCLSRVQNLQTNGNSKNKHAVMLNEQMYVLWQHIKYSANAYTNIWAHISTRIKPLVKQNRWRKMNNEKFTKNKIYRSKTTQSNMTNVSNFYITEVQRSGRSGVPLKFSCLCVGLRLPRENVCHLLIWDLLLLAQTHGLTQAGGQEMLTLPNTQRNMSTNRHQTMRRERLWSNWNKSASLHYYSLDANEKS